MYPLNCEMVVRSRATLYITLFYNGIYKIIFLFKKCKVNAVKVNIELYYNNIELYYKRFKIQVLW